MTAFESEGQIITGISVSPKASPLGSGFTLALQIAPGLKPIHRAKIQLVLDIAVIRSVVELGNAKSEITSADGVSVLQLHVEDVDLSSFTKRVKNNAAAYQISFLDNEGLEVGQLNLVASVDERDGTLYKTIFSPFR